MAAEQQRRMQMAMEAMRRRRMEAAQRQQTAQRQGNSNIMHSIHDDIPIIELEDAEYISLMPYSSAIPTPFQSTCRRGPVDAIRAAIGSKTPTPAFLHHGLVAALNGGNVEATRYLLESGAPIARLAVHNVLAAPSDLQAPLLDLLADHGWSPNSPFYQGAAMLPRVVTNISVLRWLLDHGVNPNHSAQYSHLTGTGEPESNSCAALEAAAARGTIEAVKMLLEAGAEIENGTPLHFAAGVSPPGANPHAGRVTSTKEFDMGRIPVMSLLVDRGAKVNQRLETRHMAPRYPIVHAVMAGAVERVRWLLQHGADPHQKGNFGSAMEYAKHGSEEMRKVLREGDTTVQNIDVEDDGEGETQVGETK
ncbi:unnamed protein product [Clonostachys chloroleuca]|uniref:Uncharacterized protein n=1 Tax=Clonostachys chloroleuca TaxID=1926264 RepID=A0AA35Q2R3_9HYPO|nr:unnamed protein product [Clonostachys chloroleuca]